MNDNRNTSLDIRTMLAGAVYVATLVGLVVWLI